MEERGDGFGMFFSPKLPFFGEHNASIILSPIIALSVIFGKLSRSEQVN